MARCVYCGDRSGFWSRLCGDCKKLLARVEELREKVGFGEFLDELERTGVPKEKILRFLKADPHGKGSVQDQVTAEMTSELMKVMGLKGSQTAGEVKRIRETIGKESK
jgi:thiol-disulfide isomerase/thioredoxin